jgi:hypothetical protein
MLLAISLFIYLSLAALHEKLSLMNAQLMMSRWCYSVARPLPSMATTKA